MRCKAGMMCKVVKFVFPVFALFLILTAGVSGARAVGHDDRAFSVDEMGSSPELPTGKGYRMDTKSFKVPAPIASECALCSNASTLLTAQSNWSTKPVIVNIQVNLESEEDQKYIHNILSRIESHGWITSVFVTGEFASEHPEVIREIEGRGHYIGVYGWKGGEDLSLLSYNEQLELIKKATSAVRNAVSNPEYVVDFKPQNLKYNDDTIKALQDLEMKSITATFSANESFVKCPYAKSVGKVTFPYPITTDFSAVPISDVKIGSEEILLEDKEVFSKLSAHDYLNYLKEEFDKHNETKDPMVIVVTPSVTGADETKLQVLSQFLDYVAENGGTVAPVASIIHNASASGDLPGDAPPAKNVTTQSIKTTSLSENIKKFRTDTAPELDWYQPCDGGDNLIDFYINVTGIDVSEIKSATLTLRVWDVDIPGTSDCGPEIDKVYFNGHYLGSLTGANEQWSTCTFTVDPSYIVEGANSVKIYIDTTGSGCWCVECDWGELTVQIEPKELEISVTGGLSGTIDPYEKYYSPRGVTPDGYIHATWEGGFYNNGAKVPDFPVTVSVNKPATVFFHLMKDEWWRDKFIDTEVSYAEPGSPATYNINIRKLDPGTYYLWICAEDGAGEEEEDKSITFKIERKPIFFPGRWTGRSWIWRAEVTDVEGPTWNDLVSTIIQPVGYLFGPVEGAIWTLCSYNSPASIDNMYITISWEYTPFEWDNNRHDYVQRSKEWGVPEGDTLKYVRKLRYKAQHYTLVETKTYEAAKWVLTAKDFLVEYGKYDPSKFGQAVKYFVMATDTGIAVHGARSTITKYEYQDEIYWGVPSAGGLFGGNYVPYGVFGPRPPLVDLSDLLKGAGKEPGYWLPKILYPQSQTRMIKANVESTDLFPISIDNTVEIAVFGIKWDVTKNYSLNLILHSPSGDLINSTIALSDENISHARFPTESDFAYEIYTIRNPEAGEWMMEVIADGIPIEDADYFITAFGKTNLTCSLFTNKDVYSPGENVTLTLYLSEGEEPIRNATVQVNIYPPNAEFPDIVMLYDDGNHNDMGVDDGIYGNIYTNTSVGGSYIITGFASGTRHGGGNFSRAFAEEIFIQEEPVVFIDTLKEGMVVKNTVWINISAIDNIDEMIDKYELWINETIVSNNASYLWNTTTYPNGTYKITAKAFDTDGNVGIKEINVTVRNPPQIGDPYPPSPPTGLSVDKYEGGNALVLNWNANTESDIKGYNIYRSMVSNGSYIKINAEIVTNTTYRDINVEAGRRYYYVITAVDKNLIESNYSIEVSQVPLSVWIEHFDDDSNVNATASSNITIKNSTVFLTENSTYGYVVSEPILPESLISWGYIHWVDDLKGQNATMEISQDQESWKVVQNGENISYLDPNLPLYYKYVMYSNGSVTPLLYGVGLSYLSPFNPLGFTNNYSDRGVDIDEDGLYDFLVIDVGVDVGEIGRYYLTGELKDKYGSTISFFNYSYNLVEGEQIIQLRFDGGIIHSHKVDGPFYLSNLSLLDRDNNQVDFVSDAHITTTYNYTDFKKSYAEFNDTYFDKGVDTDGDGLYNYLNVGIGIEVMKQGNYTIAATLEDNSGYEITTASNSTQLGVGNHFVLLYFDGISIRKHGVSGTYYLRNLSLYCHDEAPMQTDYRHSAYTTQAYNYVDFQKPLIAFTNLSDYGTDTNGDGLHDYLTLEVGLNVKLEGNYNIQGGLNDKEGNCIWTTNFTYLNEGNQSILLNFDGMEIYRNGVDGPYNLTCYIYDKNGDFVCQYEVYTTSIYNYTDFQKPSVEFSGFFSDYGTDTDMDGLYNYLSVDIGLNVTCAGNYTISGRLYDVNGEEVVRAYNQTYLNISSQLVTLNFDGISIYKHKVNGSYSLTLYLDDKEGRRIDYKRNVYATSAYNYTDFQMPSVEITGNYSDYGVDTDGDGLYNYLRVNVEVIVKNSGDYDINARLMDERGKEIIWAANTIYLYANMPQTLQLDFDGRYIYGCMMNGSYYLKDVHVYNKADLTQADYVYDAYTTNTYNYTEFQKSGIITGTVTDTNGIPVSNTNVYVAAVDFDVTDNNGNYMLIIPSSGTYTVEVDPPAYLLDDSAAVSVAFGQIVVQNFTLNPAGVIEGIVTDYNGTPVYGAKVVVSGPSIKETYTYVNGEYIIGKLKAGNYTVTAYPPFGAVELVSNSTTANVVPRETTFVNITLPKGGIVAGRITYENGTGIYDAKVRASGPSYEYSYTNETGYYEIVGLEAGNYTITAYPPYGMNNLLSNSTTASVNLGETTTVNLILREGGVIAGRVTYENGTGIYGAYVEVYPGWEYDYTNETGYYEIVGLEAGNYTITAYPPYGSNLLSNSTTASVTLGETTIVNLILRTAQPSVSISTDKYEYRAGDVMLINITIMNPGNEWQNVKFLWRLDIPDYNLSFKVINNKSILLPPGFKKTFVIPWRLPKWKASFNASWYVALYDGIISEDTADWRYVGATKKGGEREIAEMAEDALRKAVSLQSAKLIREMKG